MCPLWDNPSPPTCLFGKCTRICPMQKSWSDIRESITTPLMGFTIVVLFLVCFLLAMVVLVSVVRVLMG